MTRCNRTDTHMCKDKCMHIEYGLPISVVIHNQQEQINKLSKALEEMIAEFAYIQDKQAKQIADLQKYCDSNRDNIAHCLGKIAQQISFVKHPNVSVEIDCDNHIRDIALGEKIIEGVEKDSKTMYESIYTGGYPTVETLSDSILEDIRMLKHCIYVHDYIKVAEYIEKIQAQATMIKNLSKFDDMVNDNLPTYKELADIVARLQTSVGQDIESINRRLDIIEHSLRMSKLHGGCE